jgi:CRP-like cAMP-binding protein
MAASREKLHHFIQQVYSMPEQQAQTIVDLFAEKELAKGDHLLVEGKVCNEYCFLVQGFMRAYTYDHAGNDVSTGFYGDNHVVCELFSFFKRLPAQENIQALTDCHLLYITFEQLNMIFHAMPAFREFGRMILVNSYAQLKQRMLGMIRQTAEQRYAALIQTNPAIFQHAPLKNIASYLGITDTSLSRIRKEFAKNNHDGQ